MLSIFGVNVVTHFGVRRALGKLSEKCVKRISNDIHFAVRSLKS